MSVALAKVESWEDHVEAWHHLGREVDGAAWRRAAIAASLKGRYGEEAVEKFAQEVGFSRASVYDFARTFEAFPEKSERSDNLTFSHHMLAVRLTATIQDAKTAVEQAEREGWSANALRAYLRPPASPAAVVAPGDSCDSDGGACGPLTRNDKAFHVVSLVESLTQSMALFDGVKEYGIDPLFERRTKKSMADFSAKLSTIIEWLQRLETTVNNRRK